MTGPTRAQAGARVGAVLLALAAASPILAGVAAADGVYLRAGVGLDRSSDARFTDTDCATDGLYGCGAGTDGAPFGALGDFGAITGLEVGVGYRAAPALRIEGLVQSRPRAAYAGRANFLAADRRQSVSADLAVLSGLAVAYATWPSWACRGSATSARSSAAGRASRASPWTRPR